MPEEQTAQAPVTQPQGEGSAPQNKEADVTAPKVESKQETAVKTDGLPEGVNSAFASLRKEKRELKERMAKMEAELVQYRNRPQSFPAPQTVDGSSSVPGVPQTFYDNPDAYLAEKTKEVEARLERKMQEQRTEDAHRVASEKAESWLVSQKDFKSDPNALNEVYDILDSPEYHSLIRANPQKAVKLAHMEWREQKGMSTERTQQALESQARGTTAPPSGASAGGPKQWTHKELNSYASKLDPRNPADIAKIKEVETALKEGRVK